MFFDQTGERKLATRYTDNEPKVMMKFTGKDPVILKIDTVLVPYPRAKLYVGRGQHLGWIGLRWEKKESGKRDVGMLSFKRGQNISSVTIPTHNTSREGLVPRELEYKSKQNVLLIHMHQYARELDGWFYHLPHVSDNPQTVRREMDELSGM